MNIRDLQYLVAVADYQHFGKAAEHCHVSQPTLSMQVKKLEEELGLQVFERDPKNVMVTSSGRPVIHQARRILLEVDNLVALAREINDPLSGEFHLGIIPTLGPYLLPHISPVLKSALPNLHFTLHEGQTHEILGQLKQGQLDAAILALPVKGTQDFVCRDLFQEPFLMACSHLHPLAKKKGMRIDEIPIDELLLLAEGHCLKDHALEVCHLQSDTMSYNFEATSIETLRHMVAMNEGVTLLPELAARLYPVTGLETLRFKGKQPTRQISLLWRQTSAKKAACKNIVDTIQRQMKQVLS